MAARQAVHSAAEEALGAPLLVEFTGLICWRPGASIAMHFDANRCERWGGCAQRVRRGGGCAQMTWQALPKIKEPKAT